MREQQHCSRCEAARSYGQTRHCGRFQDWCLAELDRASLVSPQEVATAAEEGETASSAWLCRICLTDPVDAAMTSCGHMLCRECAARSSPLLPLLPPDVCLPASLPELSWRWRRAARAFEHCCRAVTGDTRA